MKNTFYNFNIFKYKKSIIALFIFVALSNVFAYYFKKNSPQFAKIYYRAIGRDVFLLKDKSIKLPSDCFYLEGAYGNIITGFNCVFKEKKYYEILILKPIAKTDAEFEKIKAIAPFYEKKGNIIHFKGSNPDTPNDLIDYFAIPELEVVVAADTPELAMTFVELLLKEFSKGSLKDKEIQTK
jgi:hypothetical protein